MKHEPMNCESVRQALQAGDQDAEVVLQHLESCDACAAWLDLDAEPLPAAVLGELRAPTAPRTEAIFDDTLQKIRHGGSSAGSASAPVRVVRQRQRFPARALRFAFTGGGLAAAAVVAWLMVRTQTPDTMDSGSSTRRAIAARNEGAAAPAALPASAPQPKPAQESAAAGARDQSKDKLEKKQALYAAPATDAPAVAATALSEPAAQNRPASEVQVSASSSASPEADSAQKATRQLKKADHDVAAKPGSNASGDMVVGYDSPAPVTRENYFESVTRSAPAAPAPVTAVAPAGAPVGGAAAASELRSATDSEVQTTPMAGGRAVRAPSGSLADAMTADDTKEEKAPDQQRANRMRGAMEQGKTARKAAAAPVKALASARLEAEGRPQRPADTATSGAKYKRADLNTTGSVQLTTATSQIMSLTTTNSAMMKKPESRR